MRFLWTTILSGPLVPWLCLKHMPMLLRALATTKGAVERGSGKGKEVPFSKAKERESPRVEPNPRRKKMTIAGRSKVNATDSGQRDIGPVNDAPPGIWLTFTSRARKENVNMSPTSPLSQKLRSATTWMLTQAVETSEWAKMRTTFLMTSTYLGTCSNLQSTISR